MDRPQTEEELLAALDDIRRLQPAENMSEPKDLEVGLLAALAQEFGIDPEKITCWVVAIEHDRGDELGLTMSATVSPTAQPWLASACAKFLKRHADGRW